MSDIDKEVEFEEVKCIYDTDEFKEWYDKFITDRKMFAITKSGDIIFPDINSEGRHYSDWFKNLKLNINDCILGFYYRYDVFVFYHNKESLIPNINIYDYFKLQTLFNVSSIGLGYTIEVTKLDDYESDKFIIKRIKNLNNY